MKDLTPANIKAAATVYSLNSMFVMPTDNNVRVIKPNNINRYVLYETI